MFIRIATALIAALWRLASRSGRLKTTTTDGSHYVVRHKKHKGTIQSTRIGIPFRSSSYFYLGKEGRIERFCKRFGLAEEFQTGDRIFDSRIYIGSDNPDIAQALANSRDLRQQLIKGVWRQSTRIWADGAWLWIRVAGQADPMAWVPVLDALKGPLAPAQRPFFDAFTAKVLLLETIAWSIFGYAAGSFIEISIGSTQDLVNPLHMIFPAAMLCVAGLGLLAIMLRTMLAGSARAPKLIAEVGIITAIGLPLSSFDLLSDINRTFDHSTPVVLDAKVTRKFERTSTSRSRRGSRRTSTTYHLEFPSPGAPVSDRAGATQRLTVDDEIFHRATVGSTLRLTIGRGRLGHPWYRAIDVVAP